MKRLPLSTLLAAVLIHSPACATSFQIIVSGILAQGARDDTGALRQGMDLSGLPAEAIFTFDTTGGVYGGVSHPFGNANWSELYDAGTNPGNHLTIKIGTASASAMTLSPNTQEKIDKEVYYTYGPKTGYLNGTISSFLNGQPISATFNYDFLGKEIFASSDLLAPFYVPAGSPYTQHIEAQLGGGEGSLTDDGPLLGYGGLLDPATISISGGPVVVPEPITWWLMLGGLLTVGVVLRAQRTGRPQGQPAES